MKALIAIVLGGLLGSALGGGAEALIGAVLGWLLYSHLGLLREVDRLQERLQALARGSSTPSHAALEPNGEPTPEVNGLGLPRGPSAELAQPAQPARAPTPGLAPRPAVAASSMPAVTAGVGDASALDATTVAPPVQAAEPASPSSSSSPSSPTSPNVAPPLAPLDTAITAARSWLLGGNTVAKVGVAMLFIGLAFLAKFATDHVQVPVELRLAGIAAAALALLGLGWRLRHGRSGYALVLQGGAVAVLYLVLFSAFKLYSMLGLLPVFVAMVLVAALAAALAVLQNSLALAFIGALGGFATPLLLSTGGGNAAALFGYYLVLNLGLLLMAWFRTWRWLNVLGFVFTFVVATAWGVLSYRDTDYAMSQAYLLAFFLLFAVVLVLPARRAAAVGPAASASASPAASGSTAGQPGAGGAAASAPPVPAADPQGRWINGSLLFGLPTVAFGMQLGLVRNTAYGAAFSALALAMFYVGLALYARRRPAMALLFEATLAIAAVFLTLVIPFALDARSTAGAWSLEGAGLVWLGLRQQRRLPRALGYLLLLGAGLAMGLGHSQAAAPTQWWNATALNALLSAAGCLVAARAVQGHRAALSAAERLAEPLLVGWATLWLASAAAVQISALVVVDLRFASTLACLGVVAAAYAWGAARLQWPCLAAPTAALAPLLLLAVALGHDVFDAPWQHGGAWAWPLALAAHLAVLRWAAPLLPAAATFMHTCGGLALVFWGASAGRAITAAWGDDGSAWRWLGAFAVPAAALVSLPRPALQALWPLRQQPKAYATWVAAVLAVVLGLWALVANIESNGSAQPLPHVPLLNPLDLGIAVALFASALWWRSAGALPAKAAAPHLAVVSGAVLAFLWLNGMLVRAFHHWGGVPYRLSEWSASLAVQTGLSLLWSITALGLMWWAQRRVQRVAWLVGAGLLAAVVLKLLLVDLSGSGTVTRIVSFIGVGLLMLLIGYVAPLPAAAATPRRDDAG